MILQAADGLTPNFDEGHAWVTLGTLPAAAGATTDLDVTFAPGGQSLLTGELSTGSKQFALRTRGAYTFDTCANPARLRGTATLRAISTVTLHVDLTAL